ncbi:centromere protein J [Ischnura elegans]|uniref:centromere protein J n=1 Tax=Ischnura elegans TaxID=197161 RepID=UPI001ED86ECA|nr:centromere protein J [Ischnura elegans]
MGDLYKGDLFKKLQELKEWQAKQQEKLLSQQKEQQEVLMKQHKKTMEMIGLRKNADKKAFPLKEHPFNPVFEDSIRRNDPVASNHGENDRASDYSDNDKENVAGNVSLDDIPVKPIHKDFKELLEEKLKMEEPGIMLKGEPKVSTEQSQKRKFLKKGEGLKRFRMKLDGANKKCLSKNMKSATTPLSSVSNSGCKIVPVKSSHPSENQRELRGHGEGGSTSESPTWANVLIQQKKPEVNNKYEGSEEKTVKEDKKSKYEGVDLQVFELLEQMAVDSSFCSSSSTLLQFMEAPVISTPLKAILEKKEQSSVSNKKLPFGLDSSGEESDDTKRDFDSSFDSCYSEAHKAASAVLPKAVATQNVARVRFSNHVEKREFDPGIEESSVEESLVGMKKQFGDTEAWSDDDSNSDSDSERSVVSKQPESIKLPDKHDDVKSYSARSQCVTENIPSKSQHFQDESYQNDHQVEQDSTVVIKSDVLRQKMIELEHEIEKFRKENDKLNHMKRQHEQIHANWFKEKKEAERKLQEKEEILKSTVLEERKKFNREKQVFERYCRELRSQPTKQEREEIQSLQQKLSSLQQEMRQKESRNAAAQARITTRLKTLESENLQLKQEVEKLKKEKLLEAKKYQRLSSKSNAKSLHAINNQISDLQNCERDLIAQDVVPLKPIPSTLLREESKMGVKQQPNQNKPRALVQQRRRTLATSQGTSSKNAVGVGASIRRIHSVPDLMQDEAASDDVFSNVAHTIREHNVRDQGYIINDADVDLKTTSDGISDTGTVKSTVNHNRGDAIKCKSLIESSVRTLKNSQEENAKGGETLDKSLLEIVCDSLYPDEISRETVSARRNINQTVSVKVYPLEKINPDGSREIRYENGNFKHISPDGKSSKLFFYNGDVKETLADGTVRYYYSETRTWHTTFADGLEVLEFPNGQVERHWNGTKEVSFPDGTVRLIHSNGKEEVMLQDGTVATIEANGDQLIQLPNGQKEYQTKEYKKRVYPDGTVKIVYSDGVQETRYANGRIRLKDADGNLVMDQNPDAVSS